MQTHEGRQPVFLTMDEVAARWGISRRTLEGWRFRDIGPRARKLGNLVRYHIEDVLAFERSTGM